MVMRKKSNNGFEYKIVKCKIVEDFMMLNCLNNLQYLFRFIFFVSFRLVLCSFSKKMEDFGCEIGIVSLFLTSYGCLCIRNCMYINMLKTKSSQINGRHL